MNKLSPSERVQIIAALVEGNSINSVCRMTGRSNNTVLKLLADIGAACQDFHNKTVTGLTTKRVQCDEIWAFCHCKNANVRPENRGKLGHGDVWTWTAIDADTKLMITWHVGNRMMQDAKGFMNDVAGRLTDRVQLSSDGFGMYIDGVLDAFDHIDFGQLIKSYGKDPAVPSGRYSPAVCTAAVRTPRFGNPDLDHISTSYVERSNLTMRMHMRRFTRLTNGFSKKLENLMHAVALHFVHYNFCRVHQTLRVTPAMEAGLADHVWGLEELVALLD
jgi:IS1 family transposase